MADKRNQFEKNMGDLDIVFKQFRNSINPNQEGTTLQQIAYEIGHMTEAKFMASEPTPSADEWVLYYNQQQLLLAAFVALGGVSNNAPGSFEVV